jgi:hypothetical protein
MSAPHTQPGPFQLTPNPSELDVQLQTLVDTHGINAVGTSLAHQYGKTRVIAATLGQQPDRVSCVSIQHPTVQRPAAHPPQEAPQSWYQAGLNDITEHLTAMGERLERQVSHQCLPTAKTLLLSSAQAALGVAINCLHLCEQTPEPSHRHR